MKQNNDIRQIHQLIERYFDATTTEAEERQLRHLLATTKFLTPEIEQARAVIGFYAASKEINQKKRKRTINLPRIAAAVVIAAVSATAATLFFSGNETENRCIAYVGGVEITDQDHVLSIMHEDLQLFEDAADNIEADLDNELSILAGELTL